MSQGIWIRRRDWKETSKQTTATESRRKEPLAGTRPRAKRKTPSERLQHSDDRHSDRGGMDETALTPETRVMTLRLSTAPHPSAITVVHNNIRATATLFSSLRCPTQRSSSPSRQMERSDVHPPRWIAEHTTTARAHKRKRALFLAVALPAEAIWVHGGRRIAAHESNPSPRCSTSVAM